MRQQRVVADDQTLAGKQIARDLGQVPLIEQRRLYRAFLDQAPDGGRPQRRDPVQPLHALQVLPNASCRQHAPVPDQHDPTQPEAGADLVHLRRHRRGIPRRALEDLDGHRTTFRGTQQADDDLQFAPLAVARVSALGQLAATALEVAGGHVVQDQGVLPEVTPGQGVLDGLLAGTQEPVHGPVDLVFIDGAETEGFRKGGECGLAGERPGGGQFGLGLVATQFP